MISRYLTLLTLAPMWVSASAAAYFSAGPSSDSFPSNLTTENVAGVIPAENCYKHGFTTDGWTVEAVGSSVYSFVCPTHSESDEVQDARLTTASFTVEESGAWLRWDAKSVLPGFSEAYDVVVVETDSNEQTAIASIEEEDSQWQTRLASLDEFAGKEIYVSFICRSVNKYMLAVKDIFAGVPDSPEWVIDNNGSRYVAFSDGASASGVITNTGGDAIGASVVCKVGDEEMIQEVNGTWNTGESLEYKFSLPVSLNEATSYIIGIKDADGNFTELAASDVFASHFKRTLFVDEGTGMWCNNCPDGILALDKLKKEYGGDIIEVSCHVNDPLAMPDYWSELKFYAVPYMMLNRNRQTVGGTSKNFSKEYFTPTTAEISLPDAVLAVDGVVGVDAIVRFAENLDNSEDRYRVAYTLVADFFSPDSQEYYQLNNLTFPRGEQYYILPSFIPPYLARFENVVIDDAYSFSGIMGSLPSSIEPLADYQSSFSIPLPQIAASGEEVRVVAYLIDTDDGTILNASSSSVSLTNGVGSVCDDNVGMSVKISKSGLCLVEGVSEQADIVLTVTDSQGRIFDSFHGTPRQIADRMPRYPSGIAIVRVASGEKVAVAKHFSGI